MRKLFVLIFGLLLVAVCYHSPPGEVKISNETNYNLPGEMIAVPVITTEERGAVPVVIKGPLQEVKAHNMPDILIVQNHYLVAIISKVQKGRITNKGSSEEWNYIAYIRSIKEGNFNEQKARRVSAVLLRAKGLSLLPSIS